MTKLTLTEEQLSIFSKIESELRKECAIQYIKNGYENQTQAYIDACEKLNKKPSKNPVTSASEILNYPNVLAFIDSVKSKVAEEVQIDEYYVLKRLKEIDELDIIDIMQDDLSGFKPLSEWPKSWRTSISGVDLHTIVANGNEPIETLVKKIKWPDKTKNLELIGRHTKVKAWDKDGLIGGDDVIQKVTVEVVGANKD